MENALSKVTPLHDGDAGYRMSPQNLPAEQALLGAILQNNNVHNKIADFLKGEHFAEPVHGRIFDTIGRVIERGQRADVLTLKNQFDQDAALAERGGAKYLVDLQSKVVTIINAVDYARTIHDLYLRRQLIDVGTDVVNEAYAQDLELTAPQQIEAAEQRLFNLATVGQTEGGFRPFTAAMTDAVRMAEAAFKRSGKTTGVATGFTDMDKLLGGLHPSDLIVLAGRPSMGKTALATNIGFAAARAYRREADDSAMVEDGAVVGFFSLEMSSEQLATRILAEESGVPSHEIRQGKVSNEDFDKFVQASQRLASVKFFVDDTPAMTIAGLRTRARRLKRTHNLGLVIVDYLQLIRGSSEGGGFENRVQEISEITRGLKALAKELNVPVLALSQLSRAVEQREDKRPMLSDLRESGSIEQDADVVMFVFREEYYLMRTPPSQRPEESQEKFNDRIEKHRQRCEDVYGLAEIHVAKQRHGPIGKVTLRFDGNTTKFDNYVSGDRLPDAF